MLLVIPSAITVTAQSPTENREPRRLQSEHLPNPIRVHPKVISGGLPEGESAFKELAQRGIKTVISVDGIEPDVRLAKKYGLRYVHLPHGYDRVPETRAWELAKAVRDLPGPIYIHCHHGKHRSPAAASVACVASGLLPRHAAVGVLELAGTSPQYRGLFQSARDARPMANEKLDALQVTFRSVAEIPPVAKAMVDLEQTYSNVKLIAESNWRSPETHPDLDPLHQTLLLREHFTEMLRSEWGRAESREFRRLLDASASSAKSLHLAIEQQNSSSNRTSFRNSAASHLKRIGDHCTACHARFRDAVR